VAEEKEPSAADSQMLTLARKHLTSDDEETRLEAVRVLGQVGDARAIRLLVGALQDESAAVRGETVQVLDALGWEPPGPSKRALRLGAAGQFAEAAAEGVPAVQPLVIMLPTMPDEDRPAALDALIQIIEESVADIETQDLRALATFPELRELVKEELQQRD